MVNQENRTRTTSEILRDMRNQNGDVGMQALYLVLGGERILNTCVYNKGSGMREWNARVEGRAKNIESLPEE